LAKNIKKQQQKANEQREEAENKIVKANVNVAADVAASVALENVAKVCKHASVCVRVCFCR